MRKILFGMVLLACFIAPQKVNAEDGYDIQKIVEGRECRWKTVNITPVRPKCIIDASRRFKVPAAVILTILDVEGGEVGISAKNKNKTWDLGPMQINTCHMEKLSRYGITREDLETNGCLNVQVGTWLLKNHLNDTHGHVLEAIGRYHSNREPYKNRYQQKAVKAYRVLKSNPAKHIDRVLAKTNRLFRTMARGKSVYSGS